MYKALSAVEGGRFTIAAAFGNVHGVYAPGNVKLDPKILGNSQIYISKELGLEEGARGRHSLFNTSQASSLFSPGESQYERGRSPGGFGAS